MKQVNRVRFHKREVVRCAIAPKQSICISRRVGLLSGLVALTSGLSRKAGAESDAAAAKVSIQGLAEREYDVFPPQPAAARDTQPAFDKLAMLLTTATGGLAGYLGLQLLEQKRATVQVESSAAAAIAQRDQLAGDVAALSASLTMEKERAREALLVFRKETDTLAEELRQRHADIDRAHLLTRDAESRAAAVAAELELTERKFKEACNELESLNAVQRETAERSAAATARVQQLSMALAREMAEGEKAKEDAQTRLNAALMAKADAEEAGVRARTELAKTRGRVARLEADIASQIDQLGAREQAVAAANAHADELRGQLDSLKVKLAGVEAFAGELEVQKMAVAAENQRMADDLDTERSRVAELKVANNSAAQTIANFVDRISGLEEELRHTAEHLHAYKSELHAETATSKALHVQVAALQDRVTQGAQQLAAAREAASTAEVRATELGQKLLALQIQLEEADVRTAESQAARKASLADLAAVNARARDMEEQMDRLVDHLEKNEAELEDKRNAGHELRAQLEELQEKHSKLEATAKVLKSSQEATARQLIDSQGKIREFEAIAEKQREKAQYYKQEVERVTQDLTCLHGEVDKARAAAAAADAKVLELTNSIATFKAKSEDLGKKVEDAVSREAVLVKAADHSKTALTRMETDAQAIRREMAEAGMRSAYLHQENEELNRHVEELQAALDETRAAAAKTSGLGQQISHLQNELAAAQGFEAQVEELRQQLATRDKQLAESERALSQLRALAGASIEGEVEFASPAGTPVGVDIRPVVKADPSTPKRVHATAAKSSARRDKVRKVLAEETPAPTSAGGSVQIESVAVDNRGNVNEAPKRRRVRNSV